MKLSKAQQTVLDIAKKRIDFARTHSYEEWHLKAYRSTIQEEEQWYRNDKKGLEWHLNHAKKRYEEENNGITLASCNSRTLYKLKELGLIEIIEDSTGQHFGIDVIKVLNY